MGELLERVLGHAGAGDRELVAAQACHDVAVARGGPQRGGGLAEHPVAAEVPVDGVRALEVVEVDQDQSERVAGALVGAAGGLDVRVEQVHQRAAVCQLGERVVQRELAGVVAQLEQQSLARQDEPAQDGEGGGEDQELATRPWRPPSRRRTAAARRPRGRPRSRDGLAHGIEVRAEDDRVEEEEAGGGVARAGRRTVRARIGSPSVTEKCDTSGELRSQGTNQRQSTPQIAAISGEQQHGPPVLALHAGERHQQHAARGGRDVHDAGDPPRESSFLADVERLQPC